MDLYLVDSDFLNTYIHYNAESKHYEHNKHLFIWHPQAAYDGFPKLMPELCKTIFPSLSKTIRSS